MNSKQLEISEEEKQFNVSYDTLYLFMELLDGYGNLNVDLIDKNCHELLNYKIQLHDEIANFLKSY